jgi:hypothetical protein
MASALSLVLCSPAWAIIFDDFNVDEGHFTLAPTFSGSTRNVAATSTADPVTTGSFEGAGHEQLVIDTTTPDSFTQVRFLSGGGSPAGAFGAPANIPIVTSQGEDGWVGLAVKTDTPGWTVQMWIEIGSPAPAESTNGSVPKEVLSDGLWHIYEWNLDDDTGGPDGWGSVSGIVDGSAIVADGSHTFDSIVFRNDFAPATSTLLFDFVAKSDSGSITSVLPPSGDADFDADNDVDGADFLVWQRHNGTSDGSATLADGDATGDHNVDGADLAVWTSQFGSISAISAVPEPGSLALAAAGLTAAVACERRRR